MKRSCEDGARARKKTTERQKSSSSSTSSQISKLAGTPVESHVRRCGDYLIGPKLGISPVKSILHCLGRREGTDRYYLLKILHLGIGTKETQDERQGKMLLHTENSLLSLLEGEVGVIQKHGTFVDTALQEEERGSQNQLFYTGRRVRRVVLVLDCVAPHSFSTQTEDLVNLQHHVIREKKLSERETLVIFLNVVKIVESLHRKEIVHRDLKLGNIVLDRRTQGVTLTNFCLGKHLMREDDLLKDQRGSPAYISPDVLSGKPYLGKPSDMWALGVVLYTMLYGQFPFYDNVPQELFNKIKAADFAVPDDGRVSEDARNLIRRLLVTDPYARLKASQVRHHVEGIILMWRNISPGPDNLQVVPQLEDVEKDRRKRTAASIDIASDTLLNLTCQREFVPEVAAPVPTTSERSKSRRRETGRSGHIPVHKLGEDARPLTSEEYRLYGQVISQMRSGSASSGGGVGGPSCSGNGSGSGGGSGRTKTTRQAAVVTSNPVLVRSDRLVVQGMQAQHHRDSGTSRPANLSAPTTTSSLPATVPDQAEVLDLSQGPRRGTTVANGIGEEVTAPSRPLQSTSNSAHLGQQQQTSSSSVATHSRAATVSGRTSSSGNTGSSSSSSSSALSLVGALRRLGTRVNLVPVSSSSSNPGSVNNSSVDATIHGRNTVTAARSFPTSATSPLPPPVPAPSSVPIAWSRSTDMTAVSLTVPAGSSTSHSSRRSDRSRHNPLLPHHSRTASPNSSRHSSSGARSRSRHHQNLSREHSTSSPTLLLSSVVPTLPLPSSGGNSFPSAATSAGLAMPLAEATRLLGISLEQISRIPSGGLPSHAMATSMDELGGGVSGGTAVQPVVSFSVHSSQSSQLNQQRDEVYEETAVMDGRIIQDMPEIGGDNRRDDSADTPPPVTR